MNLEQGFGTIAIDNLIIHNTAMLDFSGRFTETPVGDDVVLWNRLGSVTEIEASVIGPSGTLSGRGTRAFHLRYAVSWFRLNRVYGAPQKKPFCDSACIAK